MAGLGGRRTSGPRVADQGVELGPDLCGGPRSGTRMADQGVELGPDLVWRTKEERN